MTDQRYGLRTVRQRTDELSSDSMRTPPRPERKIRPANERRRNEAQPLPSDMSDHGGYIRGLDGLRALAVGAVILYHVFPGVFRGGFLGVDVFFVISGFLITTLLIREDRKNNFIDLKGFWVRRARRLIPALATLILVVVPAAWAVHTDLLVGIGRQVLGALTFSTNWLEIAHGSSYFDQTSPLLFKNFWSLAIEEQFYVFWPIIMLVVLALLTVWWQRLALAATIAVGSGLLMMVLYSGDNLTRLYYGTDTHIFGIAIGVGLAFLWSDPSGRILGKAHWRRYSSAYGWTALAVLLIFMLILPDTGPWAYMGGMFAASLLTCVIIAAMLRSESILARVGEMRALRWIGTRSYGLYLWHWPILIMLAVVVPVAFGSWQYWLRSIAAIVLTGIICEISFRFVETPLRKNGFKASFARAREFVTAKREGKIAAGAVVLLVLATVVAIVIAPEKSETQRMIEAGQEGTVAISPAEVGEGTEGSEDVLSTVPPPPETISDDLDTTVPDASEVTAIGDSMIVASRTGLEAAMPGMNFVATSNLKWSDAPAVVQEALESEQIGRVVVIDFGTNAGVPDEDVVRQTVHMLGEGRMIFLVNLYSPSTFIDSSNSSLAKVAQEYPNVALIDWHAAASANPRLLQVDATHTSIDGANAFGALVKESITDFAVELSETKGVDPGQGWASESSSSNVDKSKER